MREMFLSGLKTAPVIAAARTIEDVTEAAKSGVKAVFLLGASINTIEDMVRYLKNSGKIVLVHLDLCEGLGRDGAAVEWLHRAAAPHGVISTRTPPLKRAGELGMLAVQRLFLMDSGSIRSGVRMIGANPPDVVELLPGVIPKAIAGMRKELSVPIIAGGMVTERQEVDEALCAGALAVSTNRRELWGL